MAMLMLNNIFQRTWGDRPGPKPATEYWADIIPPIKRAYPDFLFVAEAYWDLEWTLQQLGFDFCYDKRLYDPLDNEPGESFRLHLSPAPAYRDGLLRSRETQADPGAETVLAGEKEPATAIVTY